MIEDVYLGMQDRYISVTNGKMAALAEKLREHDMRQIRAFIEYLEELSSFAER